MSTFASKPIEKMNPSMKMKLLLCAAAMMAVAVSGCRKEPEDPDTMMADITAMVEKIAPKGSTGAALFDRNRPLDTLPEPTVALKVRHVGHYRDIFNDSNYVHLASAEAIGITPMSDTRSHWELRRPLVKIRSCEDFYVEPLTYSRPYLVPEAAELLHEIGRRFNDSLRARGGGDYLIRVTSVLRTPESVARLRRRNKNAIDSSVHQFGTTFDISYARFAAYSDRLPRSMVDLKGILAEVLHGLRNEGRCHVKFERKQPCFHITARKPDGQ